MNEHCVWHKTDRLLWSAVISLGFILLLVFTMTSGQPARAQPAPDVGIPPDIQSQPQEQESEEDPQTKEIIEALTPESTPVDTVETSGSSNDVFPPEPLLERTTRLEPTFWHAGSLLDIAGNEERALLSNPPLPGDSDFVIGMTWDRVWGVSTPGTTITITVNGTQMGAALADGAGFFWTTLYNANGNRPTLDNGDIVAIYEGGVLADSVTLRSITGNIDVLNETVTGNISGLASTNITLYPGFEEPNLTAYSQTTTTDGSGNFTADLSSNWNFTADERAVVAYVDGDIEVHQMLYAQRLIVQPFPLTAIVGYNTPGTLVTATVYFSDGVSVRGQFNNVTDGRSGRYEFRPSPETPLDIQDNDIVVLEVQNGDVLSRTVDTLNVTTEADTDRLTGQTEPGVDIVAKANLLTPLGWKLFTVETMADASGAFTVEMASLGDILPGQWAGAVYVADAEGDDLCLWAPAQGSLEVNQTYNSVAGIAPAPPGPLAVGQPVTLTYYSALSDTTFTYVKGADWYGNYYFDQNDGLSQDIVPGDVITVVTEGYSWMGTIEVQTMTVEADTANDRFTGSVEPPSPQVEVSGEQWDGWSDQPLFPVAGSFATSVTASSPFTASVPGIDVRNGMNYVVRHRNADEYVEQLAATVNVVRVWPQYNGVLGTLNPPGVAYTLTLRDGSGGFKALVTGNSWEPDGYIGFQTFGHTGAQIEVGDQLMVETGAGFSQTVHIPDLALDFDLVNDLLSGSAPANSLINLNVNDSEAFGFVPTDGSGAFKVALDEMQVNWGNGDLSWGKWVRLCYADGNWNHVCQNFNWPQIIVNYAMDGTNQVWGNNAPPGNTIAVTVAEPGGSVVATGTTTAGACDWCGPDGYQMEFPDNTLQAGYTVTVDFGDDLMDATVVLSITAAPDAATDFVTGTAPPNSILHANAQHTWGDWIDINDVQVDANGVYTINFGAEGWNIEYGDSFNIHMPSNHNHETQYSFWLPAPEVGVWKWNTSGHARSGGVYVYGIQYANQGNGDAENVQIVDALPASTTWAGDTSGVTPIVDSGVITWNLGNIPAGTHEYFYVTLDVSGVMTGPGALASNWVTITTTSPGDYEPGNDVSHSDPTDVWDDEAGVNVDKWASPGDPAPGEQFEYGIRICSDRGAAAGPVWLTDTFPISTTFVSWRVSPDNETTLWEEVTANDDKLVLYAPGLPGNWCHEIYVTLGLDSAAPLGMILENTVVVTTPDDIDPWNNHETNTEAQVGQARYDLLVDKNFNNGDLTPGGGIEYGIYYHNQGNSAVHAWLTDTLPADTTFEQAWMWNSGPMPPITVTDDYVVWDLGMLKVNEDGNFNVRLSVDSTASAGPITNCVTINSTEVDSTPYDNEDCVYHQLYNDGPNLFVTKNHQWNGDGQLGYNINVLNLGDETLYDVIITDTYPLSTNFNGDWGFNEYPVNVDFTDNYTTGQVIWTLELIEPGWGFGPWFNVDLDNPGELMRWYTNTVEVTKPAGDPTPGDNTYTDIAFSGSEVNWVDVNVGEGRVWACAPGGPITLTTQYEQQAWGDSCFDWTSAMHTFEPGDTFTVAAGAGTQPVVITIPDPFDASADSTTDMVWGQVNALDHEWLEIDLYNDGGPPKDVQTDGNGNFSTTFPDITRDGEGEVRYATSIAYANVTFHRRFRTEDLIMEVNYGHEWIEGSYEAGHTVWITVTDSGGTIKATATLTTGQMPWWNPGETGFSTNLGDPWMGDRPDIQPGDWVYGEVDTGYTTDVHIGEITGYPDTDADTITGTLDVNELTDPVQVRCDAWGAPGGVPSKFDTIQPNGSDPYTCAWDPVTEWDMEPGQDIGVSYQDSDGDRIYNAFAGPAPRLWISKWADSAPGEGGNFVFHVEYGNNGGAPAENVVITETLQGMTYLADTLGIAPTGSGPIVWDLGTLAAETQGRFDIFVQVTAAASETVTNTVEIATSNPYDQSDPWEKHSEWTGHVQSNDTHLNVGKWAWTDDPVAGHDTVFEVNVCNNGATASTDLTLTDTLPFSLTLQHWWGQHAGWNEVSRGDHELVISRPSIAGYYCTRVYVRATVAAGAWVGIPISNTVVITASNDLENDDNETTWWGNVGSPRTNLWIDKSWEGGTLVPGGQIRYNIGYGNDGNLPVTSTIYLTETLPAGTSFEGAYYYDEYGQHPFQAPVMETGDYVVWAFSALPNGHDDNFQLVLNVDPDLASGTLLGNCAIIDADIFETDPYDNMECVTQEIYNTGPNLRATKFGDWQDTGRIYYRSLIENIGTTTLYSVTLTDTLPSGATVNWWNMSYDYMWTGGDLGGVIAITLERLEPGWTAWLNMELDVSSAAPGDHLTNNIAVMEPVGDIYPPDNEYALTMGAGPDLTMEKWVTGGSIEPSDLLTYTLHFKNDSIWNTDGLVWITDTLPGEMEFVSAVQRFCGDTYFCDSPPDPAHSTDTELAWLWGDQPVNAYAWQDLVITVRISDTVQGGEQLWNWATLASTSTVDVEPDYVNNTDSVGITIVDPVFQVTKDYESSEIAGTPITYTLSVTNTGNEAGTNVILRDRVPTNLTNVTTDGSYDGTYATWTFGTLASGGGTATGRFSGVLPCSGTVTNDDYRVISSDQGVESETGPAVDVTVTAATIVPDFGYTPDPPTIIKDQSITFTDASTTDGPDIVAWKWDFGDNDTSTQQNPVHTYDTVGTFDVTLTVTDTCGHSETEVKADLVTVVSGCTPVTAVDFDYTPLDPAINNPVTFTATVSPSDATTPITYTWHFGDSGTTTTNNITVQHTYTTSGTFTVEVTAYNPCTAQGNITHSENVTMAPYEIFLPLLMKTY